MKSKMFIHKGEENPSFVEEVSLDEFPLEGIYVQTLCEDEEGLFVLHNRPISEMLQDEAFAQSLKCVRVVQWGYNTRHSAIRLYSEDRDFQITDYMHRITNMFGKKVGGLSVDDFSVIRGMEVDVNSVYYGDDEKPGF